MDMPYGRLFVLEYFGYGIEQPADAGSLRSDRRNDRNAQHAAQVFVIEPCAGLFHLIVHVQGDDHLDVHVDKLRGEEQVAFQVGRIDDVDHHVRHFAQDVGANIQLFGRIFGDGIGAGQVDQVECVVSLVEAGRFGIDRNPAVVPYPFMRSGSEVEQRGFAAVGVADQGYVDYLVAAADCARPFVRGMCCSLCIVAVVVRRFAAEQVPPYFGVTFAIMLMMRTVVLEVVQAIRFEFQFR